MIKPCLFLLAASFLCLTGCLRSVSSLVVNKNGTATLTDTVLVTETFVKFMGEMGNMTSGKKKKQDAKKIVRDMWSAGHLSVNAGTMGGKTKLRNAKAIEVRGQHGYVAIYDIGDINTFSYDKTSFGNKLKDDQSQGKPPAPITFALNGNTLTVRPTPMVSEKNDPDTTAKTDEELLEQVDQMSGMLGDFELSLTLSTSPAIQSTDATYASGNAITLMQIRMTDFFAALRKQPRLVEGLNRDVDPSVPGAMESALMKVSPQIRFEQKPVFTLTF